MRENLTPSQEAGLRLRTLRVERMLTREEVGLATNLSHYQIGRLERGDHEQPLKYVVRLAMLYGVSLDYIAGGKDMDKDTHNL